ncbi:MAG: hypothetical protein ACYTBS_11700 [Planctomycetota bacterium]
MEEIFGDLKSYLETRDGERKKGWWIPGIDKVWVTGSDLLEVVAELESDREKKSVGETIEPPFPAPFEAEKIKVEEYGGKQSNQQSIVITITGDDENGIEREACIQLEIDPETGEFEESSLHGWEITNEEEE